MRRLSEFNGVVFDLDGVITDTAHYHFVAWKKLAVELGIDFTLQDNENLKGVDRITSLEKILALHKDKAYQSLSQSEKLDLSNKKNAYYVASIRTLTSKDILPGAIDVLSALRSKKKKLAIASASRNAPEILSNLKLNDYFSFIANPKFSRSKPAPDIFLHAAYGLELHPAECVGLEDSIAGLKAIRASSMYSIGVGSDELRDYADVVVSDLLAKDLV